MYVVILAGGGGTRLWPLSTPDRPKPFLPLTGERTLLQLTVDRLASIVDPSDVFVVAARRYGPLVREQLPDVRVIGEPAGRNTAAAIALATVVIDRPEDEVMVVLPSDHAISDAAAFANVIRVAAEHLATGAFDVEDPLVTLGVRPDHPATGYGYLAPDLDRSATIDGIRAHPLRAFEEKPTEGRARELFGTSGTAWNAGMFVWRRRAIRAALERYTPLLTLLETAGSELAQCMAYDRLAPISIDVAVMEGAAQDGRVVMGTLDVGWSDLGSWTALLEANGVPGIDGRVIPTGQDAVAGPDDLIVRRVDDRLSLDAGPADGILDAHGPSALLAGAKTHRSTIEALLDRVAREEARA